MRDMFPLSIIAAVDLSGGFSKDGKIPWYYPEDLKYFKEVTAGSTCIMGRKTYTDMYKMKEAKQVVSDSTEIIKYEPLEILPGRQSFVISKTLNQSEVYGVVVMQSTRSAIEESTKEKVFIIGGEKIWIQSLPFVNEVFLTIINERCDCDKFFRIEYLKNFKVELVSMMAHGINVRYSR